MKSYEDKIIQIWEELRNNTFYGEDVAQEVARRILHEHPSDPITYGQSIARFVRITQHKPHYAKGVDGKRHWVGLEEVTSDGRFWTEQDDGKTQLAESKASDPAQVLLDKEEFLELEGQEPQRVKQAIRGGTRMAECHPSKKHWSLGLCRPCYDSKFPGRKKHETSLP